MLDRTTRSAQKCCCHIASHLAATSCLQNDKKAAYRMFMSMGLHTFQDQRLKEKEWILLVIGSNGNEITALRSYPAHSTRR